MRVLRWLQGQKSWKHDFDITGDQKGPPCQVNFMVGFCDLKGNLWAQALFKKQDVQQFLVPFLYTVI